MPQGFKFDRGQFNRLFPFFVLLNEELRIDACGESLAKIRPSCEGDVFQHQFHIPRPQVEEINFFSLSGLVNQMVVLESLDKAILLRGQFEPLPERKQLLFIGSPWFGSMEQVKSNGLTLHDFAFHDPLIDLLHVLKTQEIATEELKQLLFTINTQKKELQAANKRVEDFARFTMQDPDPHYRVSLNGKVLMRNPAAERIDVFTYNGLTYSPEDFWKIMAAQITPAQERLTVEAASGDRMFSFVVIYLPRQQYCNIYGRDVTAQKLVGEELKRLSLVASVNKNGVVFTAADGRIFWSNDGFCNLTGYTFDEIGGKTPIELCRGALTDKGTIRSMVSQFERGEAFDVELLFYRKNGTAFWGRTTGQPIHDERGNLVEYFSMIEDITNDKEKEAQIERLSMVARSNSKGILLLNEHEEVEWINSSYEQITGFSLVDVLGKNPLSFMLCDLTDADTASRIKKNIAVKQGFSEEFIQCRKNGSMFWSKTEMQFVEGRQGKLRQQFIVVEDITARREAEEKLRASERRWQFALEGAGEGVWEYDLVDDSVFFSTRYKKMLGYEDHEFPNERRHALMHIHPDDLTLLKDVYVGYAGGEQDRHECEFRMRNKKGDYIWILDRGMLLSRAADGKPGRIVGTHSDITERKLAEQALQIREEKYRNIIENMNLGLLEVDREEIIQFANQRFCEMCGYDLADLIGRKASPLFVRGDSQELVEQKNELRRTGQSDAYELVVENKWGETKWWLISGAPRYNDAGELVGSIGIHLDITEQKDLEIKLHDAREEAEQSAQAKELFLTNMSHEIRTPMNAILGMSRQLEKTSLNRQQQLFLHTITTAAEHLLVIINDILDMSKIDAGKLEVEQIGFRLRQVLQNAKEVMQHRADEKGLAFQAEFDEDIAPVLLGDPYRLNQILLNLLSNAIKFTDRGQVRIFCRCQREAAGVQQILIVVQDTGIGIEEKYLSSLFQKFSQEDKTTARKFGGTGLGMAITKQLVELMHGSIEVSSVKGKGTEFRLVIPFRIGTTEDLKVEQAQMVDSNVLAGKKVLLVEDNEMNRLVALAVLEPYQVVITEVENGSLAVQALRNSVFDLVLMDVQMPVLNGLEATALIRNELGLSVPVIALTANAIKGEAEHCLDAGMNAYVSKPFEEKDLIQAMVTCLNPAQLSVQRKRQPEEKKPQQAGFSLQLLKNISRDNPAFVQKMVDLFITQAPQQVRELNLLLAQEDYSELGKLAHKMKPMIDNFDIASLKSPIRELEKGALQGINHNQFVNLVRLVEKELGEVVDCLRQAPPA